MPASDSTAPDSQTEHGINWVSRGRRERPADKLRMTQALTKGRKILNRTGTSNPISRSSISLGCCLHRDIPSSESPKRCIGRLTSLPLQDTRLFSASPEQFAALSTTALPLRAAADSETVGDNRAQSENPPITIPMREDKQSEYLHRQARIT